HLTTVLSYCAPGLDLNYYWLLYTSFYPAFLAFVCLDILHAMYLNPYPIHSFVLLLDVSLRLRHVHECYLYCNAGMPSKLLIAASLLPATWLASFPVLYFLFLFHQRYESLHRIILAWLAIHYQKR